MKCCVKLCKNTSGRTLKSVNGITFHVFPVDVGIRMQWINRIQIQQWKPTKYTKICSDHFNQQDLYVTKNGLRKIRFGAVPCLNLGYEPEPEERVLPTITMRQHIKDTTPDLQECAVHIQMLQPVKDTLPEPDEQIIRLPMTQSPRNAISELEPYLKLHDTPRKKNLKNEMYYLKMINRRKSLKIRNLQRKVRNLKQKVSNIKAVLGKLEKERYISTAEAEILSMINIKSKELLQRQLAKSYNKRKRKEYSPELRAFALTLQFYSTKAYEYVRDTFDTCLPHPRTLSKWYQSINGEAGFTAEAFEALTIKAESSNHKIICNLVLDEMSIKKHVEWDGTGVEVVSVTMDGCPANTSMAKYLGCYLDPYNIKPTFKHPCANYEVAVFLDACHMLKLVRNTLDVKKIVYDYQGNQINWQCLVELNNLQKKETFHVANKLKDSHINYHRQKMKVRLASQLFSTSVADALELLSKTESLIHNPLGTVVFIRLINNLFDILNSKNMKQYKYKKPLFHGNITDSLAFFEYVKHYFFYLTADSEERPIMNTNRKTGFLGFILCIESTIFLYKRLVETEKKLVYLPTHKFSQDHLELFFCNIRAHGRTNNNPTARQFKAAYKKMLVHMEIKDSFRGNCIPLDKIEILTRSSAVAHINATNERYRSIDTEISIESDIPDDILIEFNMALDETMANKPIRKTITYIAGYVVYYLSKYIKCEQCIHSLHAITITQDHQLIGIKNQGGLAFPSSDVINICVRTECIIKSLKSKSLNAPHFNKDNITFRVLQTLIGFRYFISLEDHMYEQYPIDNHIHLLSRAIIEKYADIRLKYFATCENICETKRQLLNKIVLFRGE